MVRATAKAGQANGRRHTQLSVADCGADGAARMDGAEDWFVMLSGVSGWLAPAYLRPTGLAKGVQTVRVGLRASISSEDGKPACAAGDERKC